MRSKTLILPIVIGLAFALAWAFAVRGEAQAEVPLAQPPSPAARLAEPIGGVDASPPPPVTTYLIPLPVVPPDPATLPSHLTPEQAAAYARHLTYRQAQPLLAQLDRLRAEGRVAAFRVRPELHAVAVETSDPSVLGGLIRPAGAAAVLPDAGPPACAQAGAEALAEQALLMSRLPSANPSIVQATDPSIEVFLQPAEVYDEKVWTFVRGRTTPTTSVSLRILRGTRVIATQSTTSRSDGAYVFFPSWRPCPSYGYSWSVRPGDVVEVTANGKTVSTVVVHLSAWVDPDTDVVAGRTDPGRSVEVVVHDFAHDPCSATAYTQTVSTDSAGNFSTDFTSQVDFDRRAYATVYARDANGNATYYSGFDAYRIYAGFYDDDFSGYLKPSVAYTAAIVRGGSVLSSTTGSTNASGHFLANFYPTTIQPGDVLSVTGGGVSIQYTVPPFDVTLDPTSDQATGTTGSGRLVRALFSHNLWTPPTACSYSSRCLATTASGSGGFTLNAGMDLRRGDGADFYVYDSEGNYQYTERHVPLIVADLQTDQVSGYWGDPYAGWVTVTVSGGWSSGTAWVSSVDGRFETSRWGSPWSLAPGAVVTVTDGTTTMTMTVQSLTGRLDGDTGHLTGSAYNGHLSARLWDFDRRDITYFPWCAETTVSGGTYDLTFPDADVGGQDYAYIWSTGPDGHVTHLPHRYAFAVNVQKGSDWVYGFTETPNAVVTATLKRGGSAIAVVTGTAWSNGWFWMPLTGTVPVTVTSGDTLEVETGDGDSLSLPIPDLTANGDAANNRIYGNAPANEPVKVEAWRWSSTPAFQVVTATASGTYSADFDGYWWAKWTGWWAATCQEVDMGYRCAQPAARYYNADGHQVYVVGPEPPPPAPDIYESDDISTTATFYTGLQFHTLHTPTDTDWVSFTVPLQDVTDQVPYRVRTLNVGWGVYPELHLYDAVGTELVWDYNSLVWTPTVAGTYLVRITGSGGHCDAVYDLLIMGERGVVYLPLIMRNH